MHGGIKAELQTNFPDVKAVAVQKLIYLQMVRSDSRGRRQAYQSSAYADRCHCVCACVRE